MTKYQTLRELVDTAKMWNAVVPELKTGIVAFLDNDNVSFYVGDDEVLNLHPFELQQQALELLGITVEAPFNIYTLVAAAETLLDGDILFIDEIHRPV
jgi:hypothetical protein